MKQYFPAVAVFALTMSVSAAGLGDVKTVYLLPMSSGLEQYLASQLTTDAVLQVVTDPQRADAVLTDHLGAAFEQSLTDLYGAKPKDKEAEAAEDKGATFTHTGMQGKRGRGTIFLVNPKTHEVLWSVYELPKDNRPDGLKRSAGRITEKLAKTIKGK